MQIFAEIRKRRGNRSLAFKVWSYFAVMLALLLILVWLFQVVLLKSTYERSMGRLVASAADQIIAAAETEDFAATIDAISYQNSLQIMVIDSVGKIAYYADEHNSSTRGRFSDSVLLRQLPQEFENLLFELASSENGRASMKVDNSVGGQSLLYAALYDSGCIFISTPLEAVDSTVTILKAQFLEVCIVALLLSLLLSLFLARRISDPVSRLTRSAGQMATGDLSVHFESNYCRELDELADTLNHTARELSRGDKMQKELVANVSHDLRTPLTMIKGYAEMILDISGDNKEKREANLRVIVDEADRLSDMVTDLLEVSRLQSGNEDLTLRPLDLSELLAGILGRFTPIAERDGIRFETDICPEAYVYADRGKIARVLYNLIANAVNHIGDDKWVAVSLTRQAEDGKLRFAVRDHGSGIAEEELPFIWKRYYKGRMGRMGMGSGLGLSIVHGFLQLHRADFGVDSRLGEGSCFWFTLPEMEKGAVEALAE